MQGFLFEHARKKNNPIKGRRPTVVYAVAQDLDAAMEQVFEQYPVQKLRLVDEGQHVLSAARALGLEDGTAKVVHG